MSTERLTMTIEGLSCGGGGALAVERAIARTPGVVRVYVNPMTEAAYIEYDSAVCDPSQLARAVERAGFQAGRSVAR
jgi:copper chaperone CopZ